jgi:hypothetical protein
MPPRRPLFMAFTKKVLESDSLPLYEEGPVVKL